MAAVAPTSFTIPAAIRKQAGRRAVADGISLAGAVRLLLAGYASGRIAIIAAPATEAVRVERVEVIPMATSMRTLADQAFTALRKHDRRSGVGPRRPAHGSRTGRLLR